MLFTGEKTPPFIAKECPEMGQLNIDWARLQATAEKKKNGGGGSRLYTKSHSKGCHRQCDSNDNKVQ